MTTKNTIHSVRDRALKSLIPIYMYEPALESSFS